MDPVVHFEMPSEDRARMNKFYESVFGWKTETLGEEMGGYTLATTTEVDEATRMPKTPGSINGGFYDATQDPVSKSPSFVIAVKDIDASIEKVKASGGTIHGEKQEIPNVGTFIAYIDTEGNRGGILQPSGQM